MTEGKQKMEDWFANQMYYSLDPKKILLLSLLLQKNKRNLTEKTVHSINLTVLNSFEQCKMKIKISTLHDRRSRIILKHQMFLFVFFFSFSFFFFFYYFFYFIFLQSTPIWLSHERVCTNYSLVNSILLMLYPIT